MGIACRGVAGAMSAPKGNEMQGKGSIRFAELFADTVQAHGVAWAAAHYAKKGMPLWECMFWLRATRVAPAFVRLA